MFNLNYLMVMMKRNKVIYGWWVYRPVPYQVISNSQLSLKKYINKFIYIINLLLSLNYILQSNLSRYFFKFLYLETIDRNMLCTCRDLYFIYFLLIIYIFKGSFKVSKVLSPNNISFYD